MEILGCGPVEESPNHTMNIESRLRQRKTTILQQPYLVYRSLWPLIEQAISTAIESCPNPTAPCVLDVGCGEKPYADLFPNAHYVGLNYGIEAASPDIVGDAQSLPVRDQSIDIVFSTQVVEHVPEPKQLISEAFRVLKSSGILVLTGPFYWPLHEEPHDFYRFTIHGFQHMLTDAGFEVHSLRGDAGAVTQVAVSLIEILPRSLRMLIPLINLVTPWMQRLSTNDKSTLNYVAIAKKP